MSDAAYPLFSVFAFLGFLVGLIPLPWHFQAWNAGTCVYMLWASLASLVQFVNSIIWNGRVDNVSPVWCDIATKFMIGAGVGIPAASLCINRRLYSIASVRTVSVSRKDKRRALFTDATISVGVPLLVMTLHYIVQGHRYNILEDVGCIPTTYYTPPAFPLVLLWPPLIGCVSFIYAALSLREFWIRRAQFHEMLSSSNSLTSSRYLRLMLLSCIEMACTIPISAVSIYIGSDGVDLAPWISWADTHYNFSFVERFPARVWKGNPAQRISVEMSRCISPCSAFLFFALFGFADEAKRNYRVAFNWFKVRLASSYWRRSASSKLGPRTKSSARDSKAQYLASEASLPTCPSPVRLPKRTYSLFSSVGTFHDVDLEKNYQSSIGVSSTSGSSTSTIIAPTHADETASQVSVCPPAPLASLDRPSVSDMIPAPATPTKPGDAGAMPAHID